MGTGKWELHGVKNWDNDTLYICDADCTCTSPEQCNCAPPSNGWYLYFRNAGRKPPPTCEVVPPPPQDAQPAPRKMHLRDDKVEDGHHPHGSSLGPTFGALVQELKAPEPEPSKVPRAKVPLKDSHVTTAEELSQVPKVKETLTQPERSGDEPTLNDLSKQFVGAQKA